MKFEVIEEEISFRRRPTIVIALFLRTTSIDVKLLGEVRLAYSHGCWRTHSWLLKGFKGKGYGSRMYLRAIQWARAHNQNIGSSDLPSEEATNVWKSRALNRRYRIQRGAGAQPYRVTGYRA